MLYVVATGSILKSTDRGVSWTPANTGMPLNVVGVAIDSKNSGTVFAAVTGGGNQTGGVFRSADGGMTWARSKVPRGGGVEGFAADPRDSSRLFAWNSQGFYASTDGAVTWSDFSNSTFAFGVIVDPHDSNTLYGLSYADQFRSVVKSVDGGVTWSGAGAGLPEYVISGLAVHPQDGQTVYAWSNRYSPPGPRFFKSADGGATWTPAVSGLQGNATVGFAMDPHNPANLFAATSGFDSAGVPVNAVWTSSDAGAHWVPFLPRTLDRLYIQGLVTDGSVLYALTSGGVYSIAVGGQ